ncbi:hypothetical protein ACFFX0_26985 [Citricoccus parietis]|uniref:Uncharacterized protein n=1 Tax=Citricoccus parietis TaxID=592307 RepID=A0ABV5G6Q2_9MICC
MATSGEDPSTVRFIMPEDVPSGGISSNSVARPRSSSFSSTSVEFTLAITTWARREVSRHRRYGLSGFLAASSGSSCNCSSLGTDGMASAKVAFDS